MVKTQSHKPKSKKNDLIKVYLLSVKQQILRNATMNINLEQLIQNRASKLKHNIKNYR